MTRGLIALLVVMMSLCAYALAEECVGPAATAVSAGLYDTPKKDAAELMRYFIGVRVEVVREVDAEYVQVNVGEQGGSLMGYMRKAELAFGEAAIRRVRADRVYCVGEAPKPCTLYGYPDTRSEVVEQEVMPWSVLGMRGSEWLHVQVYDGCTGFVSRADLPGMSLQFDSSVYVRTEPVEGEFTREEAIEIARKEMLECEDSGVYLGVVTVEGEQVDAQRLARCTPEVDIIYYYDQPDTLQYGVFFRDADGSIYAGLDFIARGREVLSIELGNG